MHKKGQDCHQKHYMYCMTIYFNMTERNEYILKYVHLPRVVPDGSRGEIRGAGHAWAAGVKRKWRGSENYVLAYQWTHNNHLCKHRGGLLVPS